MPVASQPETDPETGSNRSSTPPDSARLIISLNPRAGSRSRHDHVQAIGQSLTRAGFNVRMTSDLGELEGLATEGLELGELRVVLAVGGDGTASVVRNHVPLEVPILPVPMGTENLLGRYVGSDEPDAVCRRCRDGVVGISIWGEPNDKIFLLMISAGFDAEVIRTLHENRRGNITRLAYFLPTLAHDPELRLPANAAIFWEAERAERAAQLPVDVRIQPAVVRPGPADRARRVGHRRPAGRVYVRSWRNVERVRYLWHVRERCTTGLADAVIFAQARRFRLEARDRWNGAVSGGWRLRRQRCRWTSKFCRANFGCCVAAETADRLGFDATGT